MRLLLAVASLAASLPALAYTPDLTRLDSLPLHALPLQQVQKVLPAKPSPLQFAVGVGFPLELADGVWDRAADGRARWRTRVFSATALSLNFEFAHAALPDSAQLYLYDTRGELVQGPLTAREVADDGRLWTPMVLGDTAVLELLVDAAQRDAVALQLGAVHHGFKDATKASGSSGACNVNVACALGDAWRADLRAVGMITIGGNFQCTGQLLNNVRQNDTPLFLTANHCEIGASTATPAASVVVYWNYQSGTCGGTSGSLSQSQVGSVELADDGPSDFSLLRLNSAPSSSFNVYYAGWNASPTQAPGSGAAIHHPQSDIKKISTFSSTATRVTTEPLESNGPSIQAWRVVWAQGTTEQGSSGAGLLNQNHQLVGVLSGGAAACSSSNPGVGNGQPDYFGRLDAAWLAQATSSHQLKAWLDPDNTGTCALCGKNPGSTTCTVPAPVDCPAGSGGGGGGTQDGGGGGSLPGSLLAVLATGWMLRRRSRR